jgi:hypothetical protein
VGDDPGRSPGSENIFIGGEPSRSRARATMSPTVFISYAQEQGNRSHSARVKALADSLKGLGLDVLLDQYLSAPPTGNWGTWMEQGLETADFVLIICTEAYARRWKQEEQEGVGLGVIKEATLTRAVISRQPDKSAKKFIPILLEGALLAHVPTLLFENSRYAPKAFGPSDPEFARLVFQLTGRHIDGAGGPTGPRVLRFAITPEGESGATSGYAVYLDCDELGTAGARFDGDPLKEQTTVEALGRIQAGRDEPDDLGWVGGQLWGGMLAGEVDALFERARAEGYRDGRMFHLRLALPRALEGLPWEALHDPDGGFLANREQYCVIRTGSRESAPAPEWGEAGRKPGVLLVLPSGSDLDLDRERRIVADLVAASAGVRLEVLDGTVTLDRVDRRIREGTWDVVHFAGHGRSDEKGRVELLFNDEEGGPRWVGGDAFAVLFNRGDVRLVLLNCCRGGKVHTDRSVAALGPMLLGRRVAAVIAMQYEVNDDVAVRFAEEFYRGLLTGAEPGRVDVAVEGARAALFRNTYGSSQRGFITPVLYLAPGGERLFALERPQAPPGPAGAPAGPAAIVAEPARAPLPPDLIEAVRERLCIPVIGPGLLTAAAQRDAPPMGPRQLARELGKAACYAETADFELMERGGGWLDGLVLRRVCQFFDADSRNRRKMFRLIEGAFHTCAPPEPIATLAGWDVPGYICLFFDGLMEEALKQRGRPFTVLNLSTATAPAGLDMPRLVHLCGTWRERDSDVLALTEKEYDELWDRLAKPPPWLSGLVTAEPGRSLLFLGAHPRDPLTRRLAARLLDEEVARRAGPAYFVSTDHTPADDAYWEAYHVEWVDDSPAALIAALDAATSSARGGSRP